MDEMTDGRKLTAELVGTFALIFFGAGAIIATRDADLVAIALAHGLAVALLVSSLGHISGGVFNPALTVGLWATRRISTIDGVSYIIVQLLGAVAAALVLVLLFPAVLRDVPGINLGTPQLSPNVSAGMGVGIGVVLTFFLMLAVFGSAFDRRGPRLGGLVVGLVITIDILAGYRLMGAAMNPAWSFGPALVDGTWADHWVYWVGPIIGAVGAALLYHHVFAEDETAAQAA